LDVGSGTGEITAELTGRTRGQVSGVDLDPEMVAYARQQYPQAGYHEADAHDLPFPDAHFDVVTCHFLLLWCRDPARCTAEMVRVTRPGGAVVVAAEPDYGGRIDYPDLPLREWQIQALRAEGADPRIGRRLRALFALPAVREADVGVMAGVWDLAQLRAEDDDEWSLWEQTLAGQVPASEIEQARVSSRAAIEAGTRLVFMPVFYALVRV
ncbi:MAG TPA: class I SAM-dependent methyltransferase, partial [Anaerolineae bacterium]|nr:class I SAM-dependent methyltransferase [Anaerolineae bacterium]